MSTESKVVVSAEDRASQTLGKIKGSIDASGRALETFAKVTRIAAFALGSNVLGRAFDEAIRKGAEYDSRLYSLQQKMDHMRASADRVGAGLASSVAPALSLINDSLAELLDRAAGKSKGYGLREFWGDLLLGAGAGSYNQGLGQVLTQLGMAQESGYGDGGRTAASERYRNQLMAEGTALMDRYGSAEMRRFNYIYRLEEMLAEEAINQTVYNRALAEFDRQLGLILPKVDAVNERLPLKIAESTTEDWLDETLIWDPKILAAPEAPVVTKWDQMWTTMKEAATDALQDTNRVFTDVLFHWEDRLETLSAWIERVFSMISDALIGRYVTGPLLQSVGLDKRAGGGPVFAGTPYVVGESGPELFVPGSSGSIVPNANLAGAGGVSINFTVQAIDSQSFTGALAQHERQLVAVIDRALSRRY